MKDWKTTTAGVLTFVGGLIGFVLLPYLHGQPINVNGFLATTGTGITGFLASDSPAAPK